MNLIELENLVKGVPDEYLTKEVQAPSGKIPPFLALSEIQRRKDMRQRYEAQKGAVDKPTIAEQIVGGIGSLPQGQAGPPPPAAPGGAGAPPVAPGAAPMPTPPGQPQGFAAGGQVGYATGGPTSNLGFLDRLTDEQLATYASLSQDKGIKAAAQQKLDSRASVGKSAPADYTGSDIGGVPSWSPVTVPGAPTPMSAIQANFNRARDAEAAAPAPAPVPTPAAPATARRAAPAPQVAPGGIGDIPIPPMTPVPSKIPPTKYESQAEARYAKMLENDGLFTLPEAINYDEFIQAAGQEEAAIRAAAKQEALGAALVQLGAGLSAGNMAAGFSEAGQQAQQIMKEGRRDAAAQKALAQDLKLRGMEGKREQAIQQARLSLEGAGLSANLARDTRREQEDREFRQQQMAAQAADREEARRARLQAHQLSLEKYELEKRKDRAILENDFIESRIGPPPTQTRIEEFERAKRLNPAGAGEDPRITYARNRNAVLPEVRREVGVIFGDAPAASARPDRATREAGFKYQRPERIRAIIKPEHVEYLRKNPTKEARNLFNQKFGPGWAEYYLDN